MPRSKNVKVYPEVFADFVREASIKPIRIPCDTAHEANSLRGSLYGFFGALEKATKDKTTEEDIRVLRNQSTKVVLTIEGPDATGKCFLVGTPRDMSPMAQRIAGALKTQVPADRPISADALKPSSELLDMLKKEEKGGQE